jgi:hypothetical protein
MNSRTPTGELIGYVGVQQLHDGVIVKIDNSDDRMQVSVRSENGAIYAVSFFGVRSSSLNKPEGMTLYGLAETKGEGGGRHFVFVNWDEEDDAYFEVCADDYAIAAC